MKNTFCKLAAALALFPASSFAVLNSHPDGDRHPALASLCIVMTEGDPWVCYPGGGFLVAPDVILSVAHAGPWLEVMRPVRTGFTFAEKLTGTPFVYEAYAYIPDPAYQAGDVDDPHDIALFVLKEKVPGIQPVLLPPIVNMLDKGKKIFPYFTVVGRGLSTVAGWPNLPVWGDRRYGESIASELRAGAIMIGPDDKRIGQPCIGESGSMALLADTKIVVGVGGAFARIVGVCQGYIGYTRLDTEQAREFLRQYLPASLLPK